MKHELRGNEGSVGRWSKKRLEKGSNETTEDLNSTSYPPMGPHQHLWDTISKNCRTHLWKTCSEWRVGGETMQLTVEEVPD